MITMNSQETAPVDERGPSVQGPATAMRGPGKAIASLVLAILAPLGLVITHPLAAFTLLLTFPYNGPSKLPWVAPLVLWSLPMILGSISTGLAIAVIRDAKLIGKLPFPSARWIAADVLRELRNPKTPIKNLPN